MYTLASFAVLWLRRQPYRLQINKLNLQKWANEETTVLHCRAHTTDKGAHHCRRKFWSLTKYLHTKKQSCCRGSKAPFKNIQRSRDSSDLFRGRRPTRKPLLWIGSTATPSSILLCPCLVLSRRHAAACPPASPRFDSWGQAYPHVPTCWHPCGHSKGLPSPCSNPKLLGHRCHPKWSGRRWELWNISSPPVPQQSYLRNSSQLTDSFKLAKTTFSVIPPQNTHAHTNMSNSY